MACRRANLASRFGFDLLRSCRAGPARRDR